MKLTCLSLFLDPGLLTGTQHTHHANQIILDTYTTTEIHMSHEILSEIIKCILSLQNRCLRFISVIYFIWDNHINLTMHNWHWWFLVPHINSKQELDMKCSTALILTWYAARFQCKFEKYVKYVFIDLRNRDKSPTKLGLSLCKIHALLIFPGN